MNDVKKLEQEEQARAAAREQRRERSREEQRRQDRENRRLLRWTAVVFVLCASLAVALPTLVTHNTWFTLYVSKSNEIGDTIGGIMGPTVGLIAAALTFLAFWAQIRANREQRRQFQQSLEQQEDALAEQTKQFQRTLAQQDKSAQDQKEFSDKQIILANEQVTAAKKEYEQQDLRARRERFENKFYQMLALHRENVIGIEVNRVKGRKVFLYLFHELRFLYWAIHAIHLEGHSPKLEEESMDDDIFQVAYLTFFFGFGSDSTPMVEDLAGSRLRAFTVNAHKRLKEWVNAKELLGSDEPFTVNGANGSVQWKRKYGLGTGHLTRLSHYVRHLYQAVKFVDEQKRELLDDEAKYGYIANLRAQLSVHEQLLLYYNARSVLGEPWLEKKDGENFIERYCILKSIPLNAADFYQSPEIFFTKEDDATEPKNKAGKPLFEWSEIRERMNELHTRR